MMEKVEAFKARDGSLFHTEGQAKEHEASLIWRERIHAFQKSHLNPYPSSNSSMWGATPKIIIAWEQFKIESIAATKDA